MKKKDFRKRGKKILEECTAYCKDILKHIGYGVWDKAAGDASSTGVLSCSCIDENGDTHDGFVHGVVYDEAEDVIKVLWSDFETDKVSWVSNLIWEGDTELIIGLYIRLRGKLYFPTNISEHKRTEIYNYLDTLPDQYHFFDKLEKLDDDTLGECKKLLKEIGHGVLLKPYSSFCDGCRFPQTIYDESLPCEVLGLRYNKEYDELEALLCELDEAPYRDFAVWRDDVIWGEGYEVPFVVYDMIVNKEYVALPKELDFEWNDGPSCTDTMKIIEKTFY